MKKGIALIFTMVLTTAIQATPPSKPASGSGKTVSNAASSIQAGNASATSVQSSGGSTTAPNTGSNMICPQGVKPQSANNSKCFARPTRSVQR